MKSLRWVGGAVAITAVLGSANLAYAELFSFTRITNNAGVNIEDQLFLAVTDATDGFGPKATFTFSREGPDGENAIADVYFDDGTLLGISTWDSSDGVSFTPPATPGDLPGGDGFFNTTQQWSFDADPPVEHNAIDSDVEWLAITFNLLSGQTFADTIQALNDGSLNVGLHVQAIGSDDWSDSHTTSAPPVPVPGAIALGVVGLGMIGVLRRKRVI